MENFKVAAMTISRAIKTSKKKQLESKIQEKAEQAMLDLMHFVKSADLGQN